MANTYPRRGVGAFTIIELLVVVAILSLLMAILLPGLNKARILTRRIVCQSNLRDIALGYMGYLNDNDGRFYGDDPKTKDPHYTFGGWRGRYAREGYRPVNAYLDLTVQDAEERDAKIFKCPSDKSQDPNIAIYGSIYEDLGNSYQANLILVTPNLLPTGDEEPWATINRRIRALAAAKQGTVSEPSRLLWIGDHVWYAQWDPIPVKPVCTKVHGPPHHHCAVFLDGHGAFIEIIRGIYDADKYRIQPHESIDEVIRRLQRHKKCSCEL